MNSSLINLLMFASKKACQIFLIQVIATQLLLAGESNSQNLADVRINFEIEQAKLEETFSKLESATQFKFGYNKAILKSKVRLSMNEKNVSVEKILLKVAKEANLKFKRINNQILVLKDDGTNASQNKITVIEDVDISGRITDENGEGLPGASVVVKGTSIGSTSDIEGNYQLSIADDAVLTISFVGYVTQEVSIAGRTTIDVQMELDAAQLDEIVVMGYGTVKKKDLTGSVSQISNEQLSAYPTYNIGESLRGRASGVQVTQNSGDPGSRIQVRIRGANSMIGSNEPLYVVDGFPLPGGVSFLNPSDIESIEILKDASATAIYGSRGANGVVLITSKRGTSGAGKISIDSYFGVSSVSKRYDLLNAKEYATVANEWLAFNGDQPFIDPNTINDEGTDWQDVIFRNAKIQNHTINFSGGNEKNQYSISGNYYDQEGVIITTGIKRGSLRMALDNKINDWVKLSNNLTLSRREYRSQAIDNGNLGTNLLSSALAAPPTLPVYDENGDFTRIEQEYSFGSVDMRNPLIFAANKNRSFTNSILANSTLDFQLSKSLTFKTRLGLEYSYITFENYRPIIFDGNRGSASESWRYNSTFLNENLLTYKLDMGEEHKINLVGGLTYQTNADRGAGISVSGFLNNILENNNLSAAETIGTPTSDASEWTLMSWLGRANYTLKEKYLFTFSVRADGSSRFGRDNKWGIFPSAAFAWRVSDESFFDQIGWISELKIRASYGVTGNTGLSPYQSLNQLSSVRTSYSNDQAVVGFVPSRIANPELKWETTTQLDLGYDLNVWNNRLRFTLDYYKKNTSNLLASVILPPSVGFGSILQNVGEVQNSGIEFSIGADVLTNDFKWDLSAQISGNRNKVVKLAGGNEIIGSGLNIPLQSSTNIAREGQPFGMFYGKVEAGYDETGQLEYEDINKDSFVNNLDRTIIGNPYPDFIFGLNSNFSYKNFDLGIFFEGVSGNEILFATAASHLNSFQRGTNQFSALYGNYWTSDNPDPNAKYARISNTTDYQVSDRFLEDGSYLRLKSLSLAYNVPLKKINVSWLTNLQIYASGTNLLTFTNYPGFDPEVNTRGTEDSGIGSRLRVGIDEGAYPNSRIYAIGLKIGF